MKIVDCYGGKTMGKFIVIEGPNGAGKSTCIEKVKSKLEEKGFTVKLTREPSDLATGSLVRNGEGKYPAKVYAFLIAADRCNHVDEIILSSKDDYDFIICDRYVQSSLVLQQAAGVEESLIWNLNCSFPKPDLSFVLIASEGVLQERLNTRESLTYYEKKLTRGKEIELYRKTTEFLKRKDYNIAVLENNDINQLEYNVDIMCGLIEKAVK